MAGDRCGDCGRQCLAEPAPDGFTYCAICWRGWRGWLGDAGFGDARSPQVRTPTRAPALPKSASRRCCDCNGELPADSLYHSPAEDGGTYCLACWQNWDGKCAAWLQEQAAIGAIAELAPQALPPETAPAPKPPDPGFAQVLARSLAPQEAGAEHAERDLGTALGSNQQQPKRAGCQQAGPRMRLLPEALASEEPWPLSGNGALESSHHAQDEEPVHAVVHDGQKVKAARQVTRQSLRALARYAVADEIPDRG